MIDVFWKKSMLIKEINEKIVVFFTITIASF